MSNESVTNKSDDSLRTSLGANTNGPQPLASANITRIVDTAVVEIVGEIDRSNSETLEAEISSGILGAKRIVIDLTHVRYLDSAALSMVQLLAMKGVPTDLIAPTGGRARRLLDIAGLDVALGVFETIAEAKI
jgi:anti-anti-sigma factor